MITFRFVFLWIALFAVLHRVFRLSYPVMEGNVLYFKWNLFWAGVLFFPIFWIACRGPVLGDVATYLGTFDSIPSTWTELAEYLRNLDWSGKGFRLFEGVLKILFGPDRKVFRIGVALVHSVPLIIIYRKYSEDYLFTVYLFVAAGCLNSWMMNGLRQFIAVTLIFAATPLLLQKKYLRLLLVILIAASFHISALIMIPIMFIVQGEAWNRRTILYIIFAVLAAYLFSTRESLFDMMLVGTEYEGTIEMVEAWGDDGMNPVRVLVMAAPMIAAFLCRNRLQKTYNPMINICVNMSVVTTGISLIAMVTSGIMTGRLPVYTEVYSYMLIPYILNHGFEYNSKKIMGLFVTLLYMGYYLYGYRGLLL